MPPISESIAALQGSLLLVEAQQKAQLLSIGEDNTCCNQNENALF